MQYESESSPDGIEPAVCNAVFADLKDYLLIVLALDHPNEDIIYLG